MRSSATTRDHTRYYDFHQDHDHTTEECNSLRSELDSLAQKGMLNEYIQRTEQPKFVREQGPQPQRSRNVGNKQGVGYQQAPPPLPPSARIIHMITGGLEAGGLSSKQRKLYVREVEEVLTLNVTFGSDRTYVTPSVWFLVVKLASSFNAVIGRPTLTEIQAVVSQSHLCMKFPTPMRIAKLRANMPGIPTSVSQHKLSTNPLKKPVAQKRCLFGGKRLKVTKEEVEKLLQANFVRRVDYCEWVANPMLIKKANVEAASGNERLSLLDAYSGYHQVPMAPEDEEKTSFYIDRNLKVYVDDIVVKSLKAENHLTDLDETFNNLRKNKMRLNPTKCIFGVESGKFLVFMVSRRVIEVNPEKIKTIVEMEPLKSVKDIQRLTERVAALQRFISKSANKCLPFFKIMRSGVQNDEFGKQKKFEWNLECQAAFDGLKSYLSSPPLLTKAIDGEILYLYLGISDEAISSVLVREEGKQQKPVYYTSSVLHGAELRYPIAEKATLAVVTSTRNSKGSGADAFLVGLDGYRSEHALKFNFDATNNMTKYEALLLGLQLALELKVMAIQVYSDSQLVVNQVNSICEVVDLVMMKYVALVAELNSLSSKTVFVEVLDELSFMKPKMMEISTDPNIPSWTDPIVSFLRDGSVPADKQEEMRLRKKASWYTLVDGILYKRSFSLPLL
ncbi:hypothetical protein SLEP1_g51818 [Rubroshorea leprosula]|uniref:RNase H type-1 domain-containing protein n=1 Tax=Rubroshorea leprosula TaxID=152421 RepID=A0AAV5M4L3_9ROSI|nr:hypothetical protein SLEP1_g51818 [Rubroshorea leprosula]